MSIFVISLVVWLILIFLSVTSGLETNWLKKLTALNAPLRVSPTDNYYSSYYYQIDSHASNSSFSFKTISEKAKSQNSDPYLSELDASLPAHLASPDLDGGILRDPVKRLIDALEEVKSENPSLTYNDFELSGALMRLALNRPTSIPGSNHASFLSQMSYLFSFPEKNPTLDHLLLTPSADDLNNILFQMNKSHTEWQKDSPESLYSYNQGSSPEKSASFWDHVELKEVLFKARVPLSFLPSKEVSAYAHIQDGSVKGVYLEKEHSNLKKGKIVKDHLAYFEVDGKKIPMGNSIPLMSPLKAQFKENKIQVQLFGSTHEVPVHWISISHARVKTHFENEPENTPYWPYFCNGSWHLPMHDRPGVLLPKSYQGSNVFVGDSGYLSYISPTAGSTQEMRLPFYVSGFYDPGIMPTGTRALFVPSEITQTINACTESFAPDGSSTNGILIWFDPIQSAPLIKAKIAHKLNEKKISSYWDLSSYQEYEFSRELMHQFQSDRTLFMLIAIIIIVVACSNIISLLVILVNDKKKEIAILSSMGASDKSIAWIFGIAGVIMGSISCIVGTLAAIFTLKHLDYLVAFLSKIQGHDAFQAAFFGDTLPNDLSMIALKFILISTPIISLLAGFIPAIKASKIKPSQILRSE